jgi:5-methylthioadenosine/S-adenosylhomocysteine deaminase
MKKVDLIVFAGWVLPIAPQNKILKDHAIAVSDGKIIEISPVLEIENKYQARTFVRLPGHVVLPSFINTHTHLAMSYFRGLGDDLPFMSWLKDYVWPAESATVGVDFVNDATRHAVVECIRSGVSCVNDHYFFENEVANILSSVGLKGLVSNP